MTKPYVAWISLPILPAIYTSVIPMMNSKNIIKVIGQLTDQLREMQDRISSLLNKVPSKSNFLCCI
jgi:TolA-binding protein